MIVPGYSLAAALFPGKDDISDMERAALSFRLSIVVVPLVGLILNFTPWGIRLEPIPATLTLFVVACVFVAQYRRSEIPANNRFSVTYLSAKQIDLVTFLKSYDRLDQLIILVLIILILCSSLVLAAVVYIS